MARHCTHIDERGFVVATYLFTDEQIAEFDGILLVDVNVPSGVGIPIRPKWDGQKWVEGATPQEIDDFEMAKLLTALQPTSQELADADLEIKILTLLFEMEVI